MKTVGHWWNRSFGRITRRDVYLETDGDGWQVRARHLGRDRVWELEDEDQAREMVQDLLRRVEAADPGESWRREL